MPIKIQIENFGDGKFFRYQHLNKQYEYLMHMHQFVELFISLDGELEITVDGRTETIGKNQAAMVLSYQPHKYDSRMINDVAILVFSTSLIPEFTSSCTGMSGNKSVFDISKATLFTLQDRIINNENYDVYDIKACLYLAIQDYLKQIQLGTVSKKATMPAAIIQYVCDHLCEHITLQSVADELGYSPKYLSNCIKKLFDMNFNDVIANVRVDKARRLLRETEKSRVDICYECGFESERSFHRQFKKIIKYTPNEYRALNLGNMRQGTLKSFN